MITEEAYWMGRDEEFPDEWTDEIKRNAKVLLGRVNDFLGATGFDGLRTVASGWRPHGINDYTAHAAKASKHLTGQAVDIKDPLRDFARFCFTHQPDLEDHGLWIEHPGWTPSWVHLQSVPPPSGRRCFIPSTEPPLDPTFK